MLVLVLVDALRSRDPLVEGGVLESESPVINRDVDTCEPSPRLVGRVELDGRGRRTTVLVEFDGIEANLRSHDDAVELGASMPEPRHRIEVHRHGVGADRAVAEMRSRDLHRVIRRVALPSLEVACQPLLEQADALGGDTREAVTGEGHGLPSSKSLRLVCPHPEGTPRKSQTCSIPSPPSSRGFMQ